MSRLRAQDGMTLPEVLIAVTAGFVVLAATLGLLESSVRLSSKVTQKTDAMQRGRLAMDRLTQQLRSQVCLNLATPAVLPGATGDSVSFYSDFGEGDTTVAPDRRTLTFDPATGSIVEAAVPGVGPARGPWTYNGAPTRNLVLENAARQTVGAQPVPIFRYYAYETTGNPPRRAATLALATPLSPAAAARVARIDVAFAARPTNATDGTNATAIDDRVSVRHADPDLAVPDPRCV